jgi:transposase
VEVEVRPYSQDLRTKIIGAYRKGDDSQRALAHRFDVSLSFVRDLLKRYRETGSVEPKKNNATRVVSKVDDDSLHFILLLANSEPALPLSQLCETLARERHVIVSRSTMWRTLRKHHARQSQRQVH